MWTKVPSSVLHFLHVGSFPIPIIHKCLLKVLCPVSRPITTLVWVLLRDNSRARVAGPEINSRACLCVLQVPRHSARCILCGSRWSQTQNFVVSESVVFDQVLLLCRYMTHCDVFCRDVGSKEIYSFFKTCCVIPQLSIPTHAQLQRHRLKFIKNHLKNSYMFRSSTIFRELQCPR